MRVRYVFLYRDILDISSNDYVRGLNFDTV